jgi:plastocyanin
MIIRRLRRAGLAAMAALLVAACGVAPASVPAAAPVGAPAAAPPTMATISAENSVFDRERLTVPANQPFGVRFQNHDVVPHNVSIHGGSVRQIGELFGGPDERTYHFEGLPAGEYVFVCDLHPAMKGTLEATAEGATAR